MADRIEIVTSIADIDAKQWDCCANPYHNLPSSHSCISALSSTGCAEQREDYNPFLSHTFLRCLEESGCVGATSGWIPAHIVYSQSSLIKAVCPSYIKTHSFGEYIFDHGWAEAYEQAGGRYYPKIQVSIPFTPVTGSRLLMSQPSEANSLALIKGLISLRNQIRSSSIHVTFCLEQEANELESLGFLKRKGQQFHFHNRGYRDFSDFLEVLNARKRKMIKRERDQALLGGIEIEALTGSAIKEEHWDAFFEFYMDTGTRKWGHPYLNREFFYRLQERMANDILLVMARRNRKWIAGALNFIGKNALYGRNWGTIESTPFLHFELCYYQAIDYALQHGLQRVEAGAQGEHKLARGYSPVAIWSAHDFADRSMKRAITDYIQRETTIVDSEMDYMEKFVPFKK